MDKKYPISTGFGGFINRVVVQVDAKYADTVSSKPGSEFLHSSGGHAIFAIETKTKKPGDDEGIVDVFSYEKFTDIPSTSWSILWDKSEYQ